MLPEARARNITGLTRLPQPAFSYCQVLLVTVTGGHKGPIFKLPPVPAAAAATAAARRRRRQKPEGGEYCYLA